MSEIIFDLQRFTTISNSVNNTIITGTSSDDSIVNYGKNVSIDGGAGRDTISGGDGKDTIIGGKGNDLLRGGDGSDVFVYANGDGNDVIYGFDNKDMLQITGTFSASYNKSKKEIAFNIDSTANAITLKDFPATTFNINGMTYKISGSKLVKSGSSGDGDDEDWEDEEDSKLITGTNGADDIENTISGATINALGGNDYVYNYSDSVTINTGDGNDSITNIGDSVTINTGAGNDSIGNWGNKVSIDGGAGHDSINNWEDSVKIDLGAGNDYIYNLGSSVTIDGGEGNDEIVNMVDANVLFAYSGGNDSIYGFNEYSTLSIGGGSYSTQINGYNIIVKVGKGKITLVDAADLDTVHITGTKAVTETNSWKLNGTTATYGTSSKTLVTVKGVQSTSGLTVDTSKKIVTVAQAALSNSNVTVSNGYKLALANNVDKTSTTSKDWSYKDSTATYSQTTSAYYTLAGNKKSITYKKATSKNLAKISGVKSKEGLSVSGNVITVPNKIIGKNVTVNGKGYKFKFAANNTAITGSGNADKIINSGAKVTITGGKGNDIISLSSAAKNNVISYSNGDGKDIIYGLTADDTIKIAKGTAATSTSGDDVIFTVGKGKITVKGAKNKTFAYSDANGNKTYSTVVAPTPDDGGDYTVSNDGKGITLSSSYAEKSFDVSEIKGGNAIVTINVSLTNGLDITGNDKANYIIGGKGNDTIDGGNDKENDTLTGGKGADIFFYSNGNGNDVISDYEAKDIIKIAKGSSVSDISSSNGRDVVLKVGKGSITVKNAAKKNIGVTYVEDGIEYGYLDGMKTLNIAKKTNDTIATLSKSYWEDSFDATNLGNEDVGKSITQIVASAVTRTLKITGNDRANTILGSSTKSNTITGGGGDDTLQGGSGADVFVYTAGDGNDSIIGYNDNDIISIASGTANYTVNANNDLVLTVGTGKIILENAGGKKLNYYDDEHRTTPYSALTSANSRSNVWLDDNYELTPDLSAIVQSKSVDYSFAKTSTELNKETNLIAYSGKK